MAQRREGAGATEGGVGDETVEQFDCVNTIESFCYCLLLDAFALSLRSLLRHFLFLFFFLLFLLFYPNPLLFLCNGKPEIVRIILDS